MHQLRIEHMVTRYEQKHLWQQPSRCNDGARMAEARRHQHDLHMHSVANVWRLGPFDDCICHTLTIFCDDQYDLMHARGR